MKEELHMYGNEFNVRDTSPSSFTSSWTCVAQKINTLFTCGYIVGMIPSEHILSRIFLLRMY